MGIYAAHGVEYHIVLHDGTHDVVLSQHETDDRLLQSDYFKEREETWFDDMYKRTWCLPISHDVIAMTPAETEMLQEKLAKFEGMVADHRWYDVNDMSDTY